MTHNIRPRHLTLGSKQAGATLIVGLVFLLLLAIVGMAAIDVTTVDVKVVANSKDRQIAFNEAESQLFQAGRAIADADGLVTQAALPQYQPGTIRVDNTWWANDANWVNVNAPSTSDFTVGEPEKRKEPALNGVSNLTQNNKTNNPAYFEYPVISKAIGPGGGEVSLSMMVLKKADDAAIGDQGVRNP